MTAATRRRYDKATPRPYVPPAPEEEWRYVPDTLRRYEVSNYGRVRSYQSSPPRMMRVSKGYVVLRVDGAVENLNVRKCVLEVFGREPIEGPEGSPSH